MRAFVSLLAAALGLTLALAAEPAPAKPRVEVVFCLDTTGSMSGLIEGAKQKIWSISNQIASGKPAPELKIGLVAYRDRGDEYVTQVHDLTEDLDAVHEKLRTFQAAGGGDEPESVNQALHDAVHKIAWSKDGKVLKIIYLVGDAMPHLDYPDDVPYEKTCALAAERGIVINTIQCGANERATPHWVAIADKAEGKFAQIAQDGGAVAIATPFDTELANLNAELSKSILVFGSMEQQRGDNQKKEAAAGLDAIAAADRAGFACKNFFAASFDLLAQIKAKKVKLEDLKKEELPVELRDKPLAEQHKFLEDLDKRRTETLAKIATLDKQRSDFIAKKQAEERAQGRQDGFDEKILATLRDQARKFGIDY